jgi:hypothetical protein
VEGDSCVILLRFSWIICGKQTAVGLSVGDLYTTIGLADYYWTFYHLKWYINVQGLAVEVGIVIAQVLEIMEKK